MIMRRNRNCENGGTSFWVAAIMIEVIIVLIVGAIVFASIVVISRARVESVPITGIPSIDHGIYPDAHVEAVEDVIKERSL